MAGNPTNVSIWDEADAFALFPEDIAPGKSIEDYYPATPDDPFEFPWQLVGLLNGGAGFEESRDRDSTKHPAWGLGAVIASFKDFEMERKLTALEDNPVTQRLKSNNDTDEYVVVSTHTPAYLGFEVRDRRGKKRRRATVRPADVIYEGSAENDSDLDEAEFTAQIWPNGRGELLWKQDENTIAGATSQPAAWTLDLSAASAGTFTLTYRGNTTEAIAFDATNTAIKAALAALDDGFKASEWSVTGTGTVSITLPKPGLVAIDGAGLTGTATLNPA